MSDTVQVQLENGEVGTVTADYADAKGLTPLEPDKAKKPDLSAEQLADTTKVRVRLPNGAEATTTSAYAAIHGLRVLDKPATSKAGQALRDKPAIDLRGKELDKALSDAGLSTGGSADEKRARLADHLATTSSGASASAPPQQ